jgi:hypothetical protein
MAARRHFHPPFGAAKKSTCFGFPFPVVSRMMIVSRKEKIVEDQYYGTGEAAALTGLPRWRLIYLVERGAIPGPSLTLPGRRLFSAADIEKIREALARMSSEAGSK